jgi:hypothetical protein
MEMKSINTIESSIESVADSMQRVGDSSVYAVIDEGNIGRFYGQVRRNNLNPTTRRTGDTLVARFDGEADDSDDEGLGELFG